MDAYCVRPSKPSESPNITTSRPRGFQRVFGYHASMSSYRHGRGRPEGLDILVEDEATAGLPSELRLDVRGGAGEGELPRQVHDLPAASDVEDVCTVHPADELGAEPNDLFEAPADPFLRGVEDLGVPVNRWDQGADEHLRIPKSPDEDPGRARAVEGRVVDQRLRLHHRVILDEDRTAGLPAQQLRRAASDAQPARDGLAGVVVEELPNLRDGQH